MVLYVYIRAQIFKEVIFVLKTSWVRIQEELISDLMRKNEEIREKRLGQL